MPRRSKQRAGARSSSGASRVTALTDRLTTRFGEDSLRARFLRGAFWSLAGAVASRAPTLVGSIIAARLLGVSSFGELGTVQNTALLFGTFAGLGLGLTATKYVAEYRAKAPERAGQHIGLSAITTLITGLMFAIPFIVLSPWLAARVLAAPGLTHELQASAGLVFFSAVNGTQNGVLAGFEAFKRLARVNTVRAILSLVLLVMGARVAGLAGAVLGLVAAEAGGAVVGAFAVRQEAHRAGIPIQYRHLRSELPVLWTFSLPALLSSMATLPATWAANVLLVRQPNGYAAMGLFTAANKWSLLILFIPSSVAAIVLPMLANVRGAGDTRAFRRLFHANVLVSICCTLLPGILIAAAAAPIMGLYGGGYRAGWLILVILALTTVPTALNTVLGQAIVSTDSIWWRFWFDVLLAVALFGCARLFIPRWGAVGMALAYAVAFSVTALGLFLFIQRHFWRGDHTTEPAETPYVSLARRFFAVLEAIGQPRRARTTLPVAWAVWIGYGAILAFLLMPNNQHYPAIIVSASVYALMPLLFPRCRPVIETPICPLNWALLIFFLQLILLPLVILYVGPSGGSLAALPSDRATNLSLLVITTGYVAFCVAYQFGAARIAHERRGACAATRWRPPGELVLLYAAIGVVGLALNFPSLRDIVSYFTSTQQSAVPAAASATLRTAAPNFLKPFLGVAFVMVWCVWIDRYGRTSGRLARLVITFGLCLPALLVYATFSFNRGAFAVPLAAMAAVYFARVRRVPIKVLAGFIGGFILFLYAANPFAGGQGVSGFIHSTQSNVDEQLQVYSAAPQFVGYVLERTNYARTPYLGRTLVSSALYPVPILGKPFRASSGVVFYNILVGRPENAFDQNLPIYGELFINFRLPGVILGFLVLGYVIARLQHAFAKAPTAIEAYFWVYIAIWILFMIVGSLSAVSQIFIYFCWPIYGYFLLQVLLAGRSRRRARSGAHEAAVRIPEGVSI